MEQNYQEATDKLVVLKTQLTTQLIVKQNQNIDLTFIDKLALLLAYVKDAVFDDNGKFTIQWFNPLKWKGYFDILRTIVSLIWDIVNAIKTNDSTNTPTVSKKLKQDIGIQNNK